MNLTAQQVFDATRLVTQIINKERPLPTRGAFLLARLHAKLLPEYNTIEARWNEMIKAYDHHKMIKVPLPDPTPYEKEQGAFTLSPSPDFSVPEDKMPEFTAAWSEIGREVLDVAVQPIPLDALIGAPITAAEFATLGDLVCESDSPVLGWADHRPLRGLNS